MSDDFTFEDRALTGLMEEGTTNETWQLFIKHMQQTIDEKDLGQAIELWAAGWKSENPRSVESPVMSWYWRRPPRKKGSKGMLFLSTNQAYRHLKRNQ